MNGKRRKELDVVTANNGGAGSDGYGEIFSLEDFVSAGRVAVSGMYTGTLKLWGSNDKFRDVSTAVQLGADIVGAADDAWQYAERAISADVMWIRLQCTVTFSEHATNVVKASVTGTVR